MYMCACGACDVVWCGVCVCVCVCVCVHACACVCVTRLNFHLCVVFEGDCHAELTFCLVLIPSQEDRHHFLRNLCLFYCKRTERECRGPWSLDDTNQTELQAIVERLMSGMLVYDPTKSLSLDP